MFMLTLFYQVMWQLIYPSILYWEVDCACDVSFMYDQVQIGVEARGGYYDKY